MGIKPVEPRKLDLIRRNIPPCDNLLDLGAGDGGYLPYLSRTAKRVVAVDIGRELCETIKQQGFEAVMADAMAIPFKDGAFECVWGSEIVEHMPSFDIFGEIERVCRRTILVTMPNPVSPHFKRDPTHILRYSVAGLARHLNQRKGKTGWRYITRGLGFYWIPGPGFFKTFTRYATYYLPWLSPTISIIGRNTRGITGGASAEDAL
jgi:ubiquinone/menaquinone biosynthesis C-methylase UbiE